MLPTMRTRYQIAVLIAALSITPSVARCQTISPVISEYQGHADGSFQIRNDTLQPFTVVLKPMSFSVDSNGEPAYRALDADVHLDLSAKSFRVAPKRQYTVFYKASDAHTPTWFTIYASIISNARAGSMNIVLDLPHTVYLLDRETPSVDDIVFHPAAEKEPSNNKLSVVVENKSSEFTRVSEIEVSSATDKEIYPGFAFFPGQSRVLQLDWTKPDPPKTIELHFKKFKAIHALPPVGTSP
jgi:hypothetical protein